MVCSTGTIGWEGWVMELWECRWVEQHVGVHVGRWYIHCWIASIVLTANQSRMACS